MTEVTAKSLPNPRHELFARLRAKGANINKAGIAAGFAQGSSTPSELEKDPDVIARIEEIKAELSAQREATREAAREAGKVIGQQLGYGKGWVISKLAENAEMARQDGDYKESNAALKLIGDELGMFQGGSAEPKEDETTGLPSYDMDAIDALASAGAEALEGPAKSESRNVDPDLALKLIDGHSSAKNRIRESRELSEGVEAELLDDEDDTPFMEPPADEAEQEPETDAAAAPEDDAPEGKSIGEMDAAGEVQWTRIDPDTPVEDILAMASGMKPIKAFDPDAPPSDERPKRRSRS